jgi:nucleotide-binding universal stress UspA family protein
MLEKILICLDGSKVAESILPYITGDPRLKGSKLILFRAVSLTEMAIPIAAPGEPGVPISTEAEREDILNRQQVATAYLSDIAKGLSERGFETDTIVIPGTSGELIVHYAADNGITMIAMGTHGHNVARRFFVGSTADYVIRHSPVPVLVIRPNPKENI